jgi:hypothetical protein
MKFTREALNETLERIGREVARIYLGFAGLAILVAFPFLCIVGLIYLGGFAWALVGGVFGIVLFLGVPFFLVLFFSIYAWRPYVWPALERALKELLIAN